MIPKLVTQQSNHDRNTKVPRCLVSSSDERGTAAALGEEVKEALCRRATATAAATGDTVAAVSLEATGDEATATSLVRKEESEDREEHSESTEEDSIHAHWRIRQNLPSDPINTIFDKLLLLLWAQFLRERESSQVRQSF